MRRHDHKHEVDHDPNYLTVEIYNEEEEYWPEDGYGPPDPWDEQILITLPACMAVCSRCEGHGSHLTESIGEHAYTSEEFYEAFDDEESRHEYFRRGGRYDVTCRECHGMRVVKVPDEEACARDPKLAADLKRIEDHLEQEQRWRDEDRHEREMGY
jgi:hypothetical protein